ncbi:MAG: CRISPR-associated helicase Cas3' [Janthinobacterium lividum]
MPPFADQPWAKLARDADRTVIAALPLVEHALDVAAAMEAVLAGGGWDRALTRTAGRALTAQDRARIVVLAALHDIGKANWGFQARWNPKADRIGHEGQVAALFKDAALMKTPAATTLATTLREWGATSYLAALMAHHGRPREEFAPQQSGIPPWEKHVKHWLPHDGYDPAAEAMRLIDRVRARWPLAWEPGAKLPTEPRFVSLFAGLMTLADWLGSDTARFPVEGPYGADRDAWRSREAGAAVSTRGLMSLETPDAGFAAAFGFEPRGVQGEAAADDLGPVALIEAETGSGKTEAALWRWLELRRRGEVDGLFFALPTRTAAVQLHRRVDAMLTRVWDPDAPRAVLAVPGYLRVGDVEGQPLPGYEVRWDDQPRGQGDDSRWAAERTNRFLAARVAVGTIDQALLGALRVKHAPVRAAALSRSLLVVDEVHASDAYMAQLLVGLLDNHVAAGGRALLLSATLGAAARARFLRQPAPALDEALAQPYPALSGRAALPRQASSAGTREKRVRIETAGLIEDRAAIAARAIEAARAGASVLVVRNSVRGAVAVAQAVEAAAPDLAFRVDGVATLHHGRFAPSDRRLLDAAVEQAFGKRRTATGRILVGTQTLEQSLDIDADLLFTDLAPMDVLLQRIGRLHRHDRDDRGAFAAARVVVLRPAERDLTRLLGKVPARDRHGLGPMSDGGGVYPDLRQIEATLRLLERNPAVTIPADNRRLVENALHPAVLDELAATSGTAWINHAARCDTIAYGDRSTAEELSLDLGTQFRVLSFPNNHQKVATRLGEQQLLVDFFPPMTGPFGAAVERIAIPHWMLRSVPADEQPVVEGDGPEGARFRLGERSYSYGRWGLEAH